MKQIIFATTNVNKFNQAKLNLKQFDVELIHKSLEMQEIQTTNGNEVVRNKAKQAFAHFKQPILVNDDTWSIPALRGFPSTGMKLCNEFLKANDWLKLMDQVKDRRIFLISYYAFHNGKTIQTLQGKYDRYFLNKPRGHHPKAPCMEVVARSGSTRSVAQDISSGLNSQKQNRQFWNKLASLLKT